MNKAFGTNSSTSKGKCLLDITPLLLRAERNVPRTPLSDKATVMGVWIFYTLFAIVAFAIKKIGRREQTKTS
jgi:hypothetical protein